MKTIKKAFYLPFAALLVYTFGIFFNLGTNMVGVSLSPGGAVLSPLFVYAISISIIIIVIALFFFSVKNKRKKEDE